MGLYITSPRARCKRFLFFSSFFGKSAQGTCTAVQERFSERSSGGRRESRTRPDQVARPRSFAERQGFSGAVVVDVLDFPGVFLDEVAARLDLLAHQLAEQFIRLERVV